MATTYYLTTTDSDLTGGTNWTKALSETAPGATTLTSSIANLATENDFGYSPSGDPGTNGGSGSQNYSASVVISTGDTSVTVQVLVARVNSSGVLQSGPTALGTAQTASAGTKSFGPTSIDLGTFASGDRLRAYFRWVNSHNHGGDEVIVQDIGSAGSTVTAPWTNTSPQNVAVTGHTSSSTYGAVTFPLQALANNFDGGSDTTTITTGNSGGDSGDAWDEVRISAGATAVYEDEQVAQGPLAAKLTQGVTPGETGLFWNSSLGNFTEAYGRIYLYWPALPTAGKINRFLSIGDIGVGFRGHLYLDQNGKLNVVDGAGGETAGTQTISPNTLYRVGYHWLAGASGTIEAKLFLGHGTSPLETITRSGVNNGTEADQIQFGLSNEEDASFVVYLDAIQVNGTDYPGPLQDVAAERKPRIVVKPQAVHRASRW